nr:response regulator transcription factor [Microbacterium bovistercoris]
MSTMAAEGFRSVFWDILAEVAEPGRMATAAQEGERVDQQGDPGRVAVVIEDEDDIRSLLADVLQQAGFRVHTAGTGQDGVDLVRRVDPIVTTLDVNMPGMDGFATARSIRAISSTYIVILTARAEEIDALQGLDAGADDYVTKPFRPRELRARIEALLRRSRMPLPGGQRPAEPSDHPADAAAATAGTDWLEHNGLRLSIEMRLASVDGVALELTRSEFDILSELMSARRRVVGKGELALMLRGQRYTGSEYLSDSDSRVIEVHMANLRRKLGESPSRPRWIETVRGVGYRLTAR